MLNPVVLFQQAHAILCLCPHCGEIVRLSDLNLHYKGTAPHTWLDHYDARLRMLEKRVESFKEAEEAIRETAHERGRQRAERLVRRIARVALPGCRYDPKDIKAVLHPIDYLVFCGMASQESQLKKIALLSIQTSDTLLNRIRQSIHSAVDHEEYNWQVVHVTDKGRITVE